VRTLNFKDLKVVLNQALIPIILVVVLPSAFLGWVAAGTFDLASLLAGLFIIATMDMAGNALNNVADWKVDELNKKRLELHRLVTRKQLLALSLFLFLCSFPLLIIGNLYLKIAILIGYLVACNYSIGLKTKNHLLLNYLTIALYYGPLAFLYGFLASSADINLLASVSWMAIFIFLIDIGFSVTKDYEDVDGDRQENKLTMPVVYGKKWSLIYQFAIINLTYLSVSALVVIGIIRTWYLLVLPTYFIAMYALYGVSSTDSKERFHTCHNIIRLTALLGRFLLAFIAWAIYSQIVT